MKRVAVLLLFVFIVNSCNNDNNTKIEKELTTEEKAKILLEEIDDGLKDRKEKIVLLSTIKGVHYDTLYSILKDYYFKLDGNYDNDTLINSALIYTTEKHGFSKSKIASFIFSFKYEMVTKDEIIENEIDHYQTEQDLETANQ